MSKSVTINDFYNEIMEQVSMAMDTGTYGWDREDFLISVILEYLEDIGEIENPVLCPFRGYGLQLNAYSLSDDFENVDIFVSIYSEGETPQNVARVDVDTSIKRAIQLYRKSINDLYTSFEKDNDTYEFAILLHNHRSEIKNVRVFAITNGLVKPIPLNNIIIEGVEISFNIWDLDRLYRCMTSGKMRETIEIDFEEMFGTTIPCIENCSNDIYSVYLSIIDGEILAKLYETHGARLLERNVRSFLQVKGAVNKSIRDTLRYEPDMFLAYNNGISVTAEGVEIIRDDNGKPSIKKIRDMQIVNGGQTTASIFYTQKDKKVLADLSRVFIQMKLSVINSPEAMDDIVPRISAFANTQNKIQMADFSANDPFHRKIEELSRITWAPAHAGMKPQNWFYERARGQYSDMLSRESTTLRKKQYKEEHPLFTKTDIAKYENSWNQLPYQVSEGAQKNFKKFTLTLLDRNGSLPDVKYYEYLIAKAILFRRTEKLVQDQQFGGYRANIVTYTIAFISYKAAQKINFDQIWKEQCLSKNLDDEIVRASKIIHQAIINPPNGANISEWCKSIRCWNSIKEIEYNISNELEKEFLTITRLVSKDVNSDENQPASNSKSSVAEYEKSIINEVVNIPAKTWYHLSRWAKETNNFQTWQRSILFSVGSIIARKCEPTYKQSNQAIKVYKEAIEKGFTI